MVSNVIEDVIVPEGPRLHSEERATLYVPNATSDTKGIASYYNGHFYVQDGVVHIKDPYINSIFSPYLSEIMHVGDNVKEQAEQAAKDASASAMSAEVSKNYAEQARDTATNVVNNSITIVKKDIMYNSKRIDNLEARLSDDAFIIDSDITAEKIVPENVAPYAEIVSVGGMTYKSKNLFDKSKVIYGQNAYGDTAVPYRAVSAFISYSSDLKVKANYVPSNIHYEIEYFSTPEYGYDTFLGASGWIETTETKSANDYASANYIVILVGAIDNTTEVTQADVDALKIQVEQGSIGDYSPYFEGLRNTKVTALKSMGANLFDKSLLENVEATETGFKFTNNQSDGTPVVVVDAFKDVVPNVKVGDQITFYSDTINSTNNVLYVVGLGQAWKKGSFITVTQEALDNNLYAYGLQGAVCEYSNFIITKQSDVPYYPYSADPIDTFAIPESVQALDDYGLGTERIQNSIRYTNNKVEYLNYCEELIFDGENVYSMYCGEANGYKFFTLHLPYFGIEGALDNWAVVSNEFKIEFTAQPGYAYATNEGFTAILCYPIDQTLDTVEKVNNWAKERYASGNPIKFVVGAKTPIVTDITDLMPTDNLIKVQQGGAIVPVNEYEFAAPTTIKYQKRS